MEDDIQTLVHSIVDDSVNNTRKLLSMLAIS